MDMLKVEGREIVDAKGRPVRLRGFGVGGWMNTENFINGYPGCEQTLRETCARELGPETAAYLFDRMLDHFLGEGDIRFMRELGATVVRLPLNYRHFESDERPFSYLAGGFERLDRTLAHCREHGLYAILDMHAIQGFQDPDWHSDNPTRSSLVWRDGHFQDRFVALWEEFARRYAGNPVVAGYNLINEPVTGAPFGFHGFPITCDFAPLNALYRRTVDAIRKIDREHIIYLEGDFFSTRFAGLDAPFAPNLVYSNHIYIKPGFGPGPYPGEFENERWDRALIEKKFVEQEGTAYAVKHAVPLWVGEFGGAFNVESDDVAHRLRSDDDQISVFEQHAAHWTIWTYKDVGMMGAVVVDPASEYMRLMEPVLRAKHAAATDSWVSNVPATRVRKKVSELATVLLEELPDVGVDPTLFRKYFEQATLALYVGTMMQTLWARAWKGLAHEDIDRVLSSFAFERCRKNEGLCAILRKHMAGR